ncbi:MAG TPA: tRNA pseudouridine(13) synthase TruD [Candidatus Absconditabacterales bacterium]|nr:tRNA pseudouridine(13) synthase TruD [Candidatus Absconditabacterales bacterium]HMT26895.1 tRNA pseudouridine(13) synthase TruD [Candidatus Absconditabacterales bacterium]
MKKVVNKSKELKNKERESKRPGKFNENGKKFTDKKKTSKKILKKPEFFIFEKSKHSFSVKEQREKPKSTDKGDFRRREIKKEDLTTLQAIEILAKKFQIPPREIGFGGLKDKDATTRQRISIPKRLFRTDTKKILSLKIKNISITQVLSSDSPIKISSHENNIFTIKLQKPKNTNHEDFKKNLTTAFEEIQKKGMRNFFGTQKFGFTGGNRRIGQDLLQFPSMKLEGDINSAGEKKFKVQAFSSFLFNAYLKKRIQKGRGDKKILGDICQKTPEGREEIMGPVPGFDLAIPTKSDNPESAYQLEKEILKDFDLTEKDLSLRKKFGIYGIRRPIKIQPKKMQISFPGDQCILQFTLGQGSYATIFIDHLEREISRQVNKKKENNENNNMKKQKTLVIKKK